MNTKTPAFDWMMKMFFSSKEFSKSEYNWIRKGLNRSSVFCLGKSNSYEHNGNSSMVKVFVDSPQLPSENTVIEDLDPSLIGNVPCATAMLKIPEDERGGEVIVESCKARCSHFQILACINYEREVGTLSFAVVDILNPSIDSSGMPQLYIQSNTTTTIGDFDANNVEHYMKEYTKAITLRALSDFFFEMLYIMSPTSFLLKDESGYTRSARRGPVPGIRKYTVIQKEGLRRLFRKDLPEETGCHLMTGHQRRAYYRKLLSGKYTKKKGQTVRVRETWVGPKSVCIEGKTYLVEEPSSSQGGQ